MVPLTLLDCGPSQDGACLSRENRGAVRRSKTGAAKDP